MGELRRKLVIGERYGLDKDLFNSSEVIVVSQTPGKLLTTVRPWYGGDTWDVMTIRLTDL